MNENLKLSRARLIVAVFGGSTGNTELTLQRAERFGRAIASRNWIILTGGTGPAKAPVKNRAIQGAIRPGPESWVGVDRIEERIAAATWTRGDGGFAIASTLNHQRNYLEACMTDGAICLEGGDGTKSELACCLLLRRPVALVGDGWKKDCDLDGNRPAALANLVTATIKTFKMTGAHKLERHQVGATAVKNGLSDVVSPYAYFSANASEEEVLDWILSMLPPMGAFPGFFPHDVAGHADIERIYSAWLTAAGRG